MTAGGAGFLLLIILGGFIAFPLGTAVAILAMSRRARLPTRFKWGTAALFSPFLLIFLASLLSRMEIIKTIAIAGLALLGLFVIALFLPFVVLEAFRDRFTVNNSESPTSLE